ncbi:MAG: SIMPL domain-containing protein [Firmicutes bacterium]|nr:SIMPL domain-containing protein [Bacillota bacterium]
MERRVTGSLLLTGLLLIVAVGLFIGGPRQRVVAAQPEARASRFLAVTGEAFVALKPDHIRLEVAVPLQPTTPENSLDQVSKVSAALRAHGISKDDIRILRSDLAYQLPGLPGGAPTGVTLLEVILRDTGPARLSEIAGAAGSQGGMVAEARYVAGRRDQAESQAIGQAMKDALAKAKVLAGSAGGTLGRVHSVESQPVVEEGSYLSGLPSVPGLPGVSASIPSAPRGSGYGLRGRVHVTYELR